MKLTARFEIKIDNKMVTKFFTVDGELGDFYGVAIVKFQEAFSEFGNTPGIPVIVPIEEKQKEEPEMKKKKGKKKKY